MFTLGQASRQLGIKRQSLTRWIHKLEIKTEEQGQARFITEEDLTKIRLERAKNRTFPSATHSGSQPATRSNWQQTHSHDCEALIEELEFLRSQLTSKDEQLESVVKNHTEHLMLLKGQVEYERLHASHQIRKKDEQIGQLQKSLDQEQRLHAGTMTQLSDAQTSVL